MKEYKDNYLTKPILYIIFFVIVSTIVITGSVTFVSIRDIKARQYNYEKTLQAMKNDLQGNQNDILMEVHANGILLRALEKDVRKILEYYGTGRKPAKKRI